MHCRGDETKVVEEVALLEVAVTREEMVTETGEVVPEAVMLVIENEQVTEAV